MSSDAKKEAASTLIRGEAAACLLVVPSLLSFGALDRLGIRFQVSGAGRTRPLSRVSRWEAK